MGGVSYELAGWWSRVGAALIDLLIGFGLPVLIGTAIGLAVDPAVGVIVGLIGVLCGFAYPSIMIWKTDGRTVGKRATGIRVLQKDGRPFDAGAAFLREFVVKGIAVSTAKLGHCRRGRPPQRAVAPVGRREPGRSRHARVDACRQGRALIQDETP